jgi:hypothetical protein
LDVLVLARHRCRSTVDRSMMLLRHSSVSTRWLGSEPENRAWHSQARRLHRQLSSNWRASRPPGSLLVARFRPPAWVCTRRPQCSVLSSAVKRLGVDAECCVVDRPAAAAIVAEARASGAELIVVKAPSGRGFEHFRRRRVTEQVVRTASCSVLVVGPAAWPTQDI